MAESRSQSLEGTIVADRYRIERLIGRGGMGTVWAGRHLSLKQLVAVKFIHEKLATSEEALRRFDLEAKAAAKIKSRHAAAVFDHGVTETGQPYIVMEYLEGETLERSIRRRGPLPLAEVTAIVTQAARALDSAHEAGIVHRDLKPDNIFLAADPESGKLGYTVKLVDFGIAKIVHDEAASGAAATQAGTVLGTPHYMSPEALTASAPVSAASDVWSLGACAFAAMTGRVPFEGDAIGDVVLKVCAAPLPVPSKVHARVPRGFDEWFAKACSRNPTQRFASARDMAVALQQLDQWVAQQREVNAYEIRPQISGVELDSLPPRGPSKATVLAGILGGMAVVFGAGAFYVAKLKRDANQAITETAASAAAVVEAENERKLREAEKYMFPDADPAPSASASAPPSPSAGARPRNPR
jgi:serine/threonine-protein kinase